MVFEITDTSFEIGNLSTWRKYQKDYFFPVNKRFQESRGVEFVSIREKLQLSMELMTDWNPWGICEVCGRPQGHGRRRKKGFCRIKINPIDTRSVSCNREYFSCAKILSGRTRELSTTLA